MSDLHELLAERTRLEKEHRGILEQIRELRKRAKDKTIIAADTRQPLDPTEVEFWQRGIKENQTLLMKAQAELGALNKRIRAAQADQSITREVAVKSEPPQCKDPKHNGEIKPGRVLFLEFFLQLCAEGLDPRQFAAFESGAHQLVDEYRKTHDKEEAS
jgi:hypothetical protein